MPKSLYSLILSDEIVAAIDHLAAQEGYSRSGYINHILAEFASLSTPEKSRKQIIQTLQQAAAPLGLRASVSAGGTLTMRTALRYKYNPAVFYVVELTGEQEALGELRVGLRSQNQALLQSLGQFFDLWNMLESRHLPTPPKKVQHTQSEKRYVRALRRPQAPLAEPETGQAIASYISLFDDCIKTFFDYADNQESAQQQAAQKYLALLPGLGFGAQL